MNVESKPVEPIFDISDKVEQNKEEKWKNLGKSLFEIDKSTAMINKLEDKDDLQKSLVNSEGDFEIEVDQSSPIIVADKLSIKSNSIEVEIADSVHNPSEIEFVEDPDKEIDSGIFGMPKIPDPQQVPISQQSFEKPQSMAKS